MFRTSRAAEFNTDWSLSTVEKIGMRPEQEIVAVIDPTRNEGMD